MANPLQPKCIKLIINEFNGYVINIVSGSKSGEPDLIACINGIFYAFEIKWGSDTPSELQKQKINMIIDAGGKAFFIRSVEQLRDVLTNNKAPIKYDLKYKMIL